MGGSGAPLVSDTSISKWAEMLTTYEVADELAAAKIPVILTANRGAPDGWEKRNLLVGPPLTKSAAAVLTDAGVAFGLAISGEGRHFKSDQLLPCADGAGQS